MSAPTRPSGVDIALVGTARIDRSVPLRLTYLLTFANRGTGHESRLRFTLILPRGLAFAGHRPMRDHTILFGSGNGDTGGDQRIVITGNYHLSRGLSVRAAWTMHGRKGQRLFHVSLSKGARSKS